MRLDEAMKVVFDEMLAGEDWSMIPDEKRMMVAFHVANSNYWFAHKEGKAEMLDDIPSCRDWSLTGRYHRAWCSLQGWFWCP